VDLASWPYRSADALHPPLEERDLGGVVRAVDCRAVGGCRFVPVAEASEEIGADRVIDVVPDVASAS
jgi:hypothetical protein